MELMKGWAGWLTGGRGVCEGVWCEPAPLAEGAGEGGRAESVGSSASWEEADGWTGVWGLAGSRRPT